MSSIVMYPCNKCGNYEEKKDMKLLEVDMTDLETDNGYKIYEYRCKKCLRGSNEKD